MCIEVYLELNYFWQHVKQLTLSTESNFFWSRPVKNHTSLNADMASKERIEVGVVIVTGWIVL